MTERVSRGTTIQLVELMNATVRLLGHWWSVLKPAMPTHLAQVRAYTITILSRTA